MNVKAQGQRMYIRREEAKGRKVMYIENISRDDKDHGPMTYEEVVEWYASNPTLQVKGVYILIPQDGSNDLN